MSDQQGASDLFQRAPSDRTRHLNAAVEITEELWSPLAKQHSKNCEFSVCTSDIQRVSSQGMLGFKHILYVYTTMQFTCMLCLAQLMYRINVRCTIDVPYQR